MSRRPALKLLLPVVAGVLVGGRLPGDPVYAFVLASLLLLSAIRQNERWGGAVGDLALVAALFSLAYGAKRMGELPPMAAIPREEPVVAVLDVTGFGRVGRAGFTVDGVLRRAGGAGGLIPCGVPVRALLRGEGPRPLPGDRIAAVGRIPRADRRRNPGGISREESLSARGLRGTFRSERDGWFRLGEAGAEDGGGWGIRALRRSIGAAIERLYPPPAAGLIAGILLGERGGIDRPRREAFARAGIAHVLAISGLHVGCIAALLFLGLSLLRVPRGIALPLVLPVLLLYGALTGMNPSVRRATAMVWAGAVAGSVGRRVDGVNLLGFTAVVLLLLSPGSFGMPGFQMSFLAAWGILTFLPGPGKRLKSLRPARPPWIRGGVQVLWVSIAAQAPLVPVLAGAWHTVSLAAPVTNIAVVPLMGVLLPTALVSVGLEPLLPGMAASFAAAGSGIVSLIDTIASGVAGLPCAAVPVAPFGTAGVFAWFAALFLLGRYFEGRLAGGRLLIGLLLLGDGVLLPGVVPPARELRITFLDVGQGECAVFECPTGETFLVDVGPWNEGWDAGDRTVAPYLVARGIDRIDAVGITHPQLDHFGGFPALLERFPVGSVLEPGRPTALSRYPEFLEELRKRGVPLVFPRRGDLFSIGGVQIRVLHPDAAAIRDESGDPGGNDACLVLRIAWHGVSVLMTGDAGAPTEADLVATFGDALSSDVLKVGHHGSRHSSMAAFLDAVDPAMAVISAGRGNRFGHPDPAVLDRLSARGIAVFRTDLRGAIVLRVRDHEVVVEDGAGRRMLRGRFPADLGNIFEGSCL